MASWLIGFFPGYCCDPFLARDGVDRRPLAQRPAVVGQHPICIAVEFLGGADLGTVHGLGLVLVATTTLQDTNVPGQLLKIGLDLKEKLQEKMIMVLPSRLSHVVHVELILAAKPCLVFASFRLG